MGIELGLLLYELFLPIILDFVTNTQFSVEFLMAQQANILTTVAIILASILTIMFAISLIVVENVAKTFKPKVVDLYTKSGFVIFVFAFLSIGIVISLILISINELWTLGISFFFLFVALTSLYLNFMKVSEFFKPEEVFDKMVRSASGRDRKDMMILVRDIRDISEKSTEVASDGIDRIERLGKEEVYDLNLENNRWQAVRHQCLAQLKELGKVFSREAGHQNLAIECIHSMLEICETTAKDIEEERLDNHDLWLIRDSLGWSNQVFESLHKNKEYREVEYRNIEFLVNHIFLVLKNLLILIEEEDSDEYDRFMQGLQLMEEIIEDSKDFEKIDAEDLENLSDRYERNLLNSAGEEADFVYNKLWALFQ